ncbi:MAG: cytosine-specific methyltransferase [Melioribacteraceae bacterium]|nr:MAG: cytosine-specific methyltransferase [Melioribacteraceae bacterium]
MKTTFGEYIKTLRTESGFTLSQLAEKLNIDTANLCKIESSKREFDLKRLPKLCNIFDLDKLTMEIELISEKIARNVYKKNIHPTVFKLAEQKMEYLSKADSDEKKTSVLKDELTLFSQVNWKEKGFSNPKATINVGTIFSGIGAFEHALDRLNVEHNIVFAGDIDKHVKKSYFANYKINEIDWHDDVTQFDAKKYRGKIDILVGGSPCQAFSMVGKRKGLEDIRGTLFYDFARVVNETQPKVFIYENVKGLTNHDGGKTWTIVQEVFEELGYNIFSKIMNSKDFGIPQHRERIFVIGFYDKTIDFEFPSAIELEFSMQDFLEDYTDSKYFLKEKGVKFVTSTKNKTKRYTQINGDVMLCQKANQQFNWHGDFVFKEACENEFDDFVFDVGEVEEKYYLSEKVKDYVLAGGTKKFKTSTKTDLAVARPLLQSMHKMHRAGVDNYVTHNKGRIRKLTPRECLRLMGFRDEFNIVVSDTQMYRQAGNSIVVDVLIAILKQMDITNFGR